MRARLAKIPEAGVSTSNFLSEAVRCGASQKKHLRDSTSSTARRCLLFSDVPQIAAYHEKQKLEFKQMRARQTRNPLAQFTKM